MASQSNNFQTFLFSSAGILIMAAILVAINLIAGQLHLRTDLTEDKLYTLSQGSKEVLSKIKSPVTIRFYCTKGNVEMPVHLKGYAKRIEDLLKEYEIAGNGKIKIEKYDPLPDSDAEDAASLDGIDGQLIQTGEKIYLGLSVNCIDISLSIPFLSPTNENSLEYDISRLIYRVIHPGDLTIGILSTLPVAGTKPPAGMPPGMPPQMQQNQEPPWVMISELKKDHEIREIESDVDVIPGDISILAVIHPKDLSDRTLYAIDQFVVKGGKLLAFVDPTSVIEQQKSPQQNMMMGGRQSTSSNLDKLFKKWGIEFDTNKIVADITFQTPIGGQGGQQQVSPSVLSLDNRAMNTEDIVTGSLDNIIFAYAGSFGGEPAEGLSKTVLLKSSKNAQLIDSYKASLPARSLMKDFEAEDKEFELALRLVGKFKTAFPDGQPKKEPSGDEDSESESEPEADSEFLADGEKDAAVILVGDVDALYDDFWVRKTSFFGQTIHQAFSDNNSLLQNCIEQLSGDSSLISIRSRGVTNRPFLVVKEKQLEAEKKYKEEISRLEEELSEAQQKVNELQRTKKDQNQRYILSAEQARELEKFREKKVEVNKRLKGLRKQLRKEIDQLENTLRWTNILAMPFAVIISGLFVAAVRRKKMVAK